MTAVPYTYKKPVFLPRVQRETEVQVPPEVGPQSLDAMLRDFPYLPPQAAVLGLGTDGGPMLLNLLDATPAALLIASQPGMGKTAMLKAILRSSFALNSPDEVKAVILANDPAEWDDVVKMHDPAYFIGVTGAYERRAGDLVMQMAGKAEQRKFGRQTGATILMVMDNLKNMVEQDYDAVLNFEWLLANAAASQIWPIVSMSSRVNKDVAAWAHKFRTRIIGRMGDRAMAQQFTGSPNPPLIQSKMQFAARIAQQWRPFWVPF